MTIEESAYLDTSPQLPSVEDISERRFTVAELADFTREEIESWPIEVVVALEEKMVKRLNMLGHEFDTTENLQKKFQHPTTSVDQYRRQVINHIVLGALPELSKAAQRQVEHQQQQSVERHKALSRRRLEERYSGWSAAAVTVDQMNEVQSGHVEEMHETQHEQSEADRELYEYTKKTEPVVADWLLRLQTLGPDVTYGPAAERDDYRNGVDLYARIPVPQEDGATREILLGIDYTVAVRDSTLKEKLWRNFQRPNRGVMHATIGDPKLHYAAVQKDERVNAVILALEKTRVDDMTEDLNLVEAHDAKDELTVQKLLKEYASDPVLQYLLPSAFHEQIVTQLEELQKQLPVYQGDRTILLQAIADHQALQEYFDAILEQRKNLRDEAEELLKNQHMYRTLRVGDRRFHQNIISYPPTHDALTA